MPRVIPASTEQSITLDDLVDSLKSGDFDPRDEDNFASWGEALKKLANNRGFLADLVVAELKDRCRSQLRDNQYSSQVILLHSASEKFILRANFWPAMEDSVIRNSGSSPFFYGVAHDHNFSFLTVGYLGPGYWSEYYEYDYDQVTGFPGEKVDLRFIEKSRLEPGKVMLYRAHRDVHNQLAADSMSVSLNIIGATATNPFEDQYRFDVENSTIDSIINRISIEPLLALSAHFGGEEGIDLLDRFAASHPSDRIRFLSLQARAAAAGGVDDRIALYEQASHRGNRYVSACAAVEAAKLERGRAWLEGQPASASA
jgi:hypothetical protein